MGALGLSAPLPIRGADNRLSGLSVRGGQLVIEHQPLAAPSESKPCQTL